MIYNHVVLPVIFALSRKDPEMAHEFVLRLLERAGMVGPALSVLAAFARVHDPRLNVSIAGLRLRNPVGLAAGFDKDARAVEALAALGLGWITVGTVVPRPQEGNPRPRIFRLPEHRAIINRMGFNSEGAAAVAKRLEAVRELGRVNVPIGVSLGKQRSTPVDDLIAVRNDYLTVLAAVRYFADYFEVNFSSPNTAGLRSLQAAEGIRAIAGPVKNAAQGKPVFLKVAPDLSDVELAAAVATVLELGLDGLIEGNTTVMRASVEGHTHANEAGGLSGAPLRQGTRDRVRAAYLRARGRVPIIGVGGIETGEDVVMLLRNGAIAIQIYTSLIYQGPLVVREINRGIARFMWEKAETNLRNLLPRHSSSRSSAGIT